MPIGVGAAMLIGSAVSGGASVAGAKLASNSAKNAAKTQSAAADRAAALNTQAWQQQQELQRPYQQAGRTAVGNLAALMNPGVPYTPQMQAQNQQRMALPPPMGGPPQGPPMAMPRGGPMGGGPMGPSPQGPPPGPPYGQPGPPMQGPPGGPMAQAMAPAGDLVTIAYPDGSGRRQVPRGMAQQFLARGERLVG